MVIIHFRYHFLLFYVPFFQSFCINKNGKINPKTIKNDEYCLNGSTRKYSGISGFSDRLPIFEIKKSNPILKVKTQLKQIIKLPFRISDKFFSFLFSVNIKLQIGIDEIKK
mgnify:CR=1 FL=1